MLRQRSESATRQTHRFNEPKAGDSSQPSPGTPPWACTLQPPQMWSLLAEQWQNQSGLLSFHPLLVQLGFSVAFLFLSSQLQRGEPRHVLAFLFRTISGDLRQHWWTKGSTLTSTILKSGYHCHHIPANAIIIYDAFKREDVAQTPLCGSFEREQQLPAPGRSKACQIMCVWCCFVCYLA